jgi:hypothetical protein
MARESRRANYGDVWDDIGRDVLAVLDSADERGGAIEICGTAEAYQGWFNDVYESIRDLHGDPRCRATNADTPC